MGGVNTAEENREIQKAEEEALARFNAIMVRAATAYQDRMEEMENLTATFAGTISVYQQSAQTTLDQLKEDGERRKNTLLTALSNEQDTLLKQINEWDAESSKLTETIKTLETQLEKDQSVVTIAHTNCKEMLTQISNDLEMKQTALTKLDLKLNAWMENHALPDERMFYNAYILKQALSYSILNQTRTLLDAFTADWSNAQSDLNKINWVDPGSPNEASSFFKSELSLKDAGQKIYEQGFTTAEIAAMLKNEPATLKGFLGLSDNALITAQGNVANLETNTSVNNFQEVAKILIKVDAGFKKFFSLEVDLQSQYQSLRPKLNQVQ